MAEAAAKRAETAKTVHMLAKFTLRPERVVQGAEDHVVLLVQLAEAARATVVRVLAVLVLAMVAVLAVLVLAVLAVLVLAVPGKAQETGGGEEPVQVAKAGQPALAVRPVVRPAARPRSRPRRSSTAC
jgi:hypothetical protein